jgi:hypothetical protein
MKYSGECYGGPCDGSHYSSKGRRLEVPTMNPAASEPLKSQDHPLEECLFQKHVYIWSSRRQGWVHYRMEEVR